MKFIVIFGIVLFGFCFAEDLVINTIEPTGDGYVKTDIAGQPYWYDTRIFPEFDPGQIVYTPDVFTEIFTDLGPFTLLSEYIDNYSKIWSKFSDVNEHFPTLAVEDPGVLTLASVDGSLFPPLTEPGTPTQSYDDEASGGTLTNEGGVHANPTDVDDVGTAGSQSIDPNARTLQVITISTTSAVESSAATEQGTVTDGSSASDNGPTSGKQSPSANNGGNTLDVEPPFASSNEVTFGTKPASGGETQNTLGSKTSGGHTVNTIAGKPTSKFGAGPSSSAESSQNEAETCEAGLWTFVALLMVAL